MPRECLMGLEVEYACVAGEGGVQHALPGRHAVLEELCRRRPHLKGPQSNDYFDHTGARFYLDGHHLEAATPEVSSPFDLVAYWQAGQQIIRESAEARGVSIYRSSVDYFSQGGCTFGFHENYLHTIPLWELRQHIVPFRISQAFLGSGGVDPSFPGLRLTLSPRLAFFSDSLEGDSRSIYCAKQESLSDGPYRRLHLTSSDNVLSHRVMLVRVASMQLLLLLIEAGCAPPPLQFQNTTRTLHKYIRDVDLKTTAPLKDGQGALTVLEANAYYLDHIRNRLDHACLPSWSREIVLVWEQLLARAADDCRGCLELDNALKRDILRGAMKRSGFTLARISVINGAIVRLCGSMSNARSGRIERDRLMRKECWNKKGVRRYVDKYDVCPGQVESVLRLRDQLCVLDYRFGQLSPRGGIFDRVEHGLDHRIHCDSEERIRQATAVPPSGTRAAERGRLIAELFSQGKRSGRADWGIILHGDEIADLSDPFATNVVWEKDSGRRRPDRWCILLASVYEQYERGDYAAAWGMLQDNLDHAPSVANAYAAWVLARLGRSAEAREFLDRCAEQDRSGVIRDRIVVERFRGLGPTAVAQRWIARADTSARRWRDTTSRADVLGHQGYIMSRCGQLHEALEVLTKALRHDVNLRMIARAKCDKADVLRMLGSSRRAEQLLDEADRIYAQSSFGGERADFALTIRAKTVADVAHARQLLRKAASIQKRLRNNVGLARTYLLDARLAPSKRAATLRKNAVRALQQQVPDLADDERLNLILSNWDHWANGTEGPRFADYFWLL